MQDSYKHKGLRKNLVAGIAKKGIKDKRVLSAIEKVPRHLFLDNIFLQFAAYEDKPFQIGAGQTISQPYTVAFQTELLDVQKGERILEIGTGSGYQTCVLLEMGAKVFSIERQKTLYEKAKQLLPALGYSPRLFYGDGYKGNSLFAPYDKILVTCGAPFIPEALIQQLKVGGLLVIPLGEGQKQTMTVVLKVTEKNYETTELGTFSFVPMLSEKSKND